MHFAGHFIKVSHILLFNMIFLWVIQSLESVVMQHKTVHNVCTVDEMERLNPALLHGGASDMLPNSTGALPWWERPMGRGERPIHESGVS